MRERKLDMLRSLKNVCDSCIMCPLGRDLCRIDGKERNPHVFSNLNFSRFVVIGQNPGVNEVIEGEPFVGDAGINFDEALESSGLDRKDFYISNTVKCFTEGNRSPISDEIARCEPFLMMELNILQPHFIVSLGSVAFGLLCPEHKFSDSFGELIVSKYGFKVFPIYHPSPRNLSSKIRKREFMKQMRLMCKLVKSLNNSYS